MMLQFCYLNKSAGYYHFVQNVVLSKSGWTKIVVKHDNKQIAEVTNDNKEYKFEMTMDNNYNILLKANERVLMDSIQLFTVELDVFDTDNNFSFKFEEGLIVDH